MEGRRCSSNTLCLLMAFSIFFQRDRTGFCAFEGSRFRGTELCVNVLGRKSKIILLFNWVHISRVDKLWNKMGVWGCVQAQRRYFLLRISTVRMTDTQAPPTCRQLVLLPHCRLPRVFVYFLILSFWLGKLHSSLYSLVN